MDDFMTFDELLDELGSLLRKKGSLRRLLTSEDACGDLDDVYKEYVRVSCQISETINILEHC